MDRIHKTTGLLGFVVGLVWQMSTSWGVETLSAHELIQKIERLYRNEASQAKMTMKIITPDWHREIKLESWTQGMEKTLVRILEPRRDAGGGTLRLKNEVWSFIPKTNKVVKVSPTMRMSSFMGSDFTHADLVSGASLEDEYKIEMMTQSDTYFLTLVPKIQTPTPTPNVWGKIEILVDRTTGLPQQESFYDEKGTKVRIMNFKDVRTLGGKTLPTTIEIVPLNQEGHSTSVTYDEIRFSKKLKGEVFRLGGGSRVSLTVRRTRRVSNKLRYPLGGGSFCKKGGATLLARFADR